MIVNSLILLCTFSILYYYAALLYYARREIQEQRSFSVSQQDAIISKNKLSPRVTLIAPAFNEEKTIINNIESLLSLQYSNYEIIIVNDGSSDSTFNKIYQAFQLRKVKLHPVFTKHTKAITSIYKSSSVGPDLYIINKKMEVKLTR